MNALRKSYTYFIYLIHHNYEFISTHAVEQ